MTPIFHIEIESGCDYSTTFTYESPETGLAVDLTGYNALMQVRQGYNGAANVNVDLSLSSTLNGNGSGITLGGTAGTIGLVINGPDTANLTFNEAVYDIVLTSSSGARTKFIKGFFTLLPSSTRS